MPQTSFILKMLKINVGVEVKLIVVLIIKTLVEIISAENLLSLKLKT